MKALSDVRDVDGLRDDATNERFSAIDKTLRDIQRGVQLVRDKQVCAILSQKTAWVWCAPVVRVPI